MSSRLICGFALLLGSIASASPLAAKTCGPLKMAASVNLVLQPGNRVMVPVTINGVAKRFILDTGGAVTQIAPSTARELRIPIQTGAMPITNAGGTGSGDFVKLDSLSFGGMTGKDIYLRVSPSDYGADGLLAPDLLNRYDVEIDFAGQKMNYFLQDHCPGKVIYWPHGDVAQIPLVLADTSWIKIPVKLNDKSLMAIIDTGATATDITSKVAQDSFGLTPSSPDMEPAGNVNNDPNLASYRHTFSSLALNGITVKNPRILIIPDRMTEAGPKYRYWESGGAIYTQKRMEAPELTLGMNVLKQLHLFFEFGEHNLYVTAGGALPESGTSPQAAAGAPKLSPKIMEIMRVAETAHNNKDYAAALAAVTSARTVSDRTPFDDYIINRFAMTIHIRMQDLAAAEIDAEAALDTDPSVIPDEDRATVYKAALQLSLNEKKYDKAAKYARLYQTTNPPASDEALIRAALNQDGAAKAN